MLYLSDPNQTGEPVLQEEGEIGQRHDQAAHQNDARPTLSFLAHQLVDRATEEIILVKYFTTHIIVNLRPSMSE